jgi:type VI secretion system protein ImpM
VPGTVLNPPAAGLFGKLPATGDFVARGLPEPFRRNWDRWVARHLAPRLAAGVAWPEGGLRFRLSSGGRMAAGLVLPSRDGAGRAFPLSVLVIAEGLPAAAGLDPWCDAAAEAARAAIAGQGGADALWAALDALDPPAGPAGLAVPMELWSRRQPPAPCAPEAPEALLDRLFGWPDARLSSR